MNSNAPRRPPIPFRLLTAWALAAVAWTGAACALGPRPETPPAAGVEPEAAPQVTGAAANPDAWKQVRTPPRLPADRPLRAAFLVVDGVYNSELMAPYDVLHHVRFHLDGAPGIDLYTVSPDGRPVTTFEGLRLAVDHGFADAPAPDVLVVPSAEGSMDRDLEDERLIGWVRLAGAGARWVMSLCDGAFVLARAGLLDGRAATTFPADYDRFASLFPAIDLRVNTSFVHDGKALTSQGGARSYDVALYLVDHLYGAEVAQGVGRGLLLPWPPPLDSPETNPYPPFVVIPRPAPDPDTPPEGGG